MKNSIEQAAILLLSMGEDGAAEVLKHMDEKQVEKIVASMKELQGVTEVNIISSLNDFLNSSTSNTGLSANADSFIRHTLVSAVGSSRAASILEHSLIDKPNESLELLAWQSVRVISDTIRIEHPQVIGLIFTHLDPEKAAKVLASLPKELRSNLIRRLSSIGPISPDALEDLSETLKEELTVRSHFFKELPLGGVDKVADIVNFLDSDLENEILQNITSEDEALSIQIQDRMFPFERINDIDDRGLQNLLRNVPNEVLILALKGTEEGLRNRLFKNMSERAAQILKDDLESLGPVQLTKVEGAQKEIVSITQRLAKEGQIILSNDDNIVM